MNLSPFIQSCTLDFGGAGSRWGIGRTVGRSCALPHVSPDPLCAGESAAAPGIPRSTVSMSLCGMHGPIGQPTSRYDEVERLETDRLAMLPGLGPKTTKLLETRGRIVSIGRRKPAVGKT